MANSKCHEAPTYAVFLPLMSLLPSPCLLAKIVSFFSCLRAGVGKLLETDRKVNIFSLRWTAGRGKMEDRALRSFDRKARSAPIYLLSE